ncbi:MAG TPA: LysM peptidoglycan-binding domain-containing protein [Gemmataceae bacterium]|nr:LysM peptidoglycan-binding domain-containing protein [Gemmataceae bacterium]
MAPPAGVAIGSPIPSSDRTKGSGTGSLTSNPAPSGSAQQPPVANSTAIPPPVPPAAPAAVPATTPLPPRTPAGASVPPLAVPGTRAPARTPIPAAPQVESFDEEEYRVKPGDTFESISTQFYRTNKYAQALLLFNRNHPLAGIGVRQEPPTLQPGQPVYIPPTRILEKRYGSVIPDLAPSPAGTSSAAPPLGGPSSNAAPAAGEAAGPRRYRVPGNGEMMWTLAQRTLNNGSRWPEISRLNPGLPPELPIPAGTVVLLPADARIEPTNPP